jgi:high-affinity iron transporter
MMSNQMTKTNWWFKKPSNLLILTGASIVAAVLVWQGITANGNPDPTTAHIGFGAAVVDTGVLVFREGLETILVLAAIMAGFTGTRSHLKNSVATGGLLALVASVVTWFVAVGFLSDLSKNVPALALQAGTGLVAVVVLTIVLNWFLHKFYWTGWISMHGRLKRDFVSDAPEEDASLSSGINYGLALLGFSSVYREGFEVVLFLQSLRLQVGSAIVLEGVLLGLFFTGIVGVLTFYAHKKLPYRKMLIVTGVLLGAVLLVMVGEEAQEMQLAGWLPTTPVGVAIPNWLGVWFSLFPTRETLVAQLVAAVIVLGSYFGGQYLMVWRKRT